MLSKVPPTLIAFLEPCRVTKEIGFVLFKMECIVFKKITFQVPMSSASAKDDYVYKAQKAIVAFLLFVCLVWSSY